MRNLNQLVVAAVVVLVSFAGSAEAQGITFYDFDDAAAWWDYFDCDAKRNILGDGGAGAEVVAQAPESRACKGFSALSRADRRAVEDFVDGTMSGPFESTKDWWNANAGSGGNECAVRQQLVAALALDRDDQLEGIQPQVADSDDPDKQLYCRDFDGDGGLRPAELEVVEGVGMAISGRGDMAMEDPEEEAPALPLVGVGLLGLLLAGRGAWLRRRA